MQKNAKQIKLSNAMTKQQEWNFYYCNMILNKFNFSFGYVK